MELVDKSLKRYSSAFVSFGALALEMGLSSFENLSVEFLASVLQVLAQARPNQARNAYAALLQFPQLYALRFDATMRKLRKQWSLGA